MTAFRDGSLPRDDQDGWWKCSLEPVDADEQAGQKRLRGSSNNHGQTRVAPRARRLVPPAPSSRPGVRDGYARSSSVGGRAGAALSRQPLRGHVAGRMPEGGKQATDRRELRTTRPAAAGYGTLLPPSLLVVPSLRRWTIPSASRVLPFASPCGPCGSGGGRPERWTTWRGRGGRDDEVNGAGWRRAEQQPEAGHPRAARDKQGGSDERAGEASSGFPGGGSILSGRC